MLSPCCTRPGGRAAASTEDVPSDGNNRARVVFQDPPAGAGVGYNGPIKLRFGAG